MGLCEIPTNKLKGTTQDSTGKIESLTVDLSDLKVEKKLKQKIQNHARQIKFYLKALDSLQECNEALLILATEYYDKSGRLSSSKCRTTALALQSHALTCYRACFIRGEKKRKPLMSLTEKLENLPMHKDIREIADKLHTHFDKDSKVSSLTILWDFKLASNGRYTPQKANRESKKLHVFHLQSIKNWIALNSKIKQLIEDELSSISQHVNKIVQEAILDR